MDDAHLTSPLARFEGGVPPSPAWFKDAIGKAPEVGEVEVAGARIETLAWGEVGDPGVLLAHGSGAHAHWYAFIAPLLARGRRVVAFSWSGMGGSDHRASYSREGFVAEAMTVARAKGLFASGKKPVFVGHSFGGRMGLAIAAAEGMHWRGAIILDPPVFAPSRRKMRPPGSREFKPHKIYPTFKAAMARFRFAPPQPCEHLYIADYIARLSLKEVEGGWTWRFDPYLWRDMRIEDVDPVIRAARCPLALLRGSQSKLMLLEDAAYMRALLAPGSIYAEIPEAEHHVMIDQPLALTAAVDVVLSGWGV